MNALLIALKRDYEDLNTLHYTIMSQQGGCCQQGPTFDFALNESIGQMEN